MTIAIIHYINTTTAPRDTHDDIWGGDDPTEQWRVKCIEGDTEASMIDYAAKWKPNCVVTKVEFVEQEQETT